MPDIGELVVGAWLTQVRGYDIVVYNHRPGGDLPESVAPTGLAGVSARLGELDVLGLNTRDRTAYLAECTTHLGGMLLGKRPDGAVRKLANKLTVAGAYGGVLRDRTGLKPQLSVWSPRVPKAVVSRWGEVQERAGQTAELIANEAYADRVREVAEAASRHTTMTGNDFYRALQLLTHLGQPVLADLPKVTRRQVREATTALNTEPREQWLTWSEVVQIHGTQHGIRAPRGGAVVSIICNADEHSPYPDRFIGPDVLRYVGQGFGGDQAMSRDNESLRQAIERGLPIRVFEKVAVGRYRDHAMWIGFGDPEWHIEPSTGRRLVVFTLRRAS